MAAAGESTITQAPSSNVFERLTLVVTSPEVAYGQVAARPAAFGALSVVIGIMMACQFLFLSTEVGQQALVDQQIQTMESFGANITPEVESRLKASAPNARYTTTIAQVIFVPISTALVAGLLLGIFNATSERTTTFKHMYAVAAHSGAVFVIQQIVLTPISYLMGEFANVTRLTVFFPMLDADGLLSHLLGGVELFVIWWLVNLAIGVAVLYRRPPRPVIITLLSIYFAIVVIIALVRAAI